MISVWFCAVCFVLAVYGISVIITQSSGPFEVFEKVRDWAEETSENLGLLFRCMLCMPTNVGIVLSLVNWFFIPPCLTPFNFIFSGTELWWLAALLDGCLAGGVCRFLWNIDDYIDKITPKYEDE